MWGGGSKTQSPAPTSGTKGLLSSCLWEGCGWLCWSMTHLMELGGLALSYGISFAQSLALCMGLAGLKDGPV